MASRKYLCGFADKRLKKSLERFRKQAESMDYYDEIYLYNEDDLDSDFQNYFRDKFSLRGFGYWVWKPQIILQTLSKMRDGDVLQYTDVGCHLNKKGLKRLSEYFEITKESETGILAFEMENQSECEWTKGDVFDYFNVRNQSEVFNGQVVSGIIFIKKCERSLAIIKKFQNVYYEDFSLVDDSQSKSPNFKDFIAHRHDQSIWSILVKTNRIPRISHSEQYALNWDDLADYPIHAKRDKEFNVSIFQKFLYKIKTSAYKFLNAAKLKFINKNE